MRIEKIATEEFMKNFEQFLAKSMKDKEFTAVKGQLNDNTISKRASYLKTFLKWCDKKGYVSLSSEFKNYRTIVSKYKPAIVIFSDEEINALKKLDLTSESECALRDYMLILLATGMRFSDLYSLKQENVEDGYITKKAKKTKIIFSVPITNETKNY